MPGFVFNRVLYNSVVRPVICQGLYFIGFFIIVFVRPVICQGLYFIGFFIIALFAQLYVRVCIL